PAGNGAGKAVTHNGHSTSRLILAGKEIAPDRYPDAKEPEEARGQLRAAQHSRPIAQSNGDVGRVVAFETTETVGARSPIAERGIRGGAPLIGTHAQLPEMHQTLRLRVRQRLNQCTL